MYFPWLPPFVIFSPLCWKSPFSFFFLFPSPLLHIWIIHVTCGERFTIAYICETESSRKNNEADILSAVAFTFLSGAHAFSSAGNASSSAIHQDFSMGVAELTDL